MYAIYERYLVKFFSDGNYFVGVAVYQAIRRAGTREY
jgi:hypothetical protein